MIFNKSLSEIKKWVSANVKSKGADENEYKYILKLCQYTMGVSRYVPFKSLCYDRALTVKKILNRKNIFSELHFGVDKFSKEMKGHVWVMRDGMVAIGGDTSARCESVRYFT